MKKPMSIMLICAAILFGGIYGYKLFMGIMMKRFFASQAPVFTVSAMSVKSAEWSSQLTAVASLRAVQGVDVTAQLSGMVQAVYFTPGTVVEEGAVLVQQNADTQIAQLNSLKATSALAAIVLKRNTAQYAAHAISKATLDNNTADYESQLAKLAEQQDVVNKMTIQAPFTGHLGVASVNVGQYLNPGDKIVSLQQLDPIYVDFYVPEQAITQLKNGQVVEVRADAFPSTVFQGTITTVNPVVDKDTRNIEIEATVSNPRSELLPGMYASVKVKTGSGKHYLTLPQTAISYNSFGNIVYVIQQNGKNKEDLNVIQRFVTTGDTRGDQIMVLRGLKEGEQVVTSGQLKLKNGSRIKIDNSIEPDNSPDPVVKGE